MTKYIMQGDSAVPIQDTLEWETFHDVSYYDLWAVRPIGDKDFNSPRLFHLNLKNEAEKLQEYLNSLEIPA